MTEKLVLKKFIFSFSEVYMEFYELSKDLRQEVDLIKGEILKLEVLRQQLENTHLYRYSYFVDNSELGIECIYAKKTKELSERENELDKVKEWLKVKN